MGLELRKLKTQWRERDPQGNVKLVGFPVSSATIRPELSPRHPLGFSYLRSSSLPRDPSLECSSCPGACWPVNRRGHPVPSALARTNPDSLQPQLNAWAGWDVSSPRTLCILPSVPFSVLRADTKQCGIPLGNER